jgi:flagellar assembly protein FliH
MPVHGAGMPSSRSPSQAADAGLYGRDGSAPAKVHEPLTGLSPLQPGLLMDEAELMRLRQFAQAAGYAEGLREGRAQGEQQGRQAGFNEAHQAAVQWAALTQSLPRALADADAAMAEQWVALAMSLAKQVLGQSLALQPEAVLVAVRELLSTEPALTGHPQLWLHPDDALLVKEHLNEDLQANGWRVRSDAHMARGGCRVQAASGEVDATLPTRWARLASWLHPSAGAPP